MKLAFLFLIMLVLLSCSYSNKTTYLKQDDWKYVNSTVGFIPPPDLYLSLDDRVGGYTRIVATKVFEILPQNQGTRAGMAYEDTIQNKVVFINIYDSESYVINFMNNANFSILNSSEDYVVLGTHQLSSIRKPNPYALLIKSRVMIEVTGIVSSEENENFVKMIDLKKVKKLIENNQ